MDDVTTGAQDSHLAIAQVQCFVYYPQKIAGTQQVAGQGNDIGELSAFDAGIDESADAQRVFAVVL